MTPLRTLMVGGVLLPALLNAEGLEPLGDEALSRESVEVGDIRTENEQAAQTVEEVERQQRELPEMPLALQPRLEEPAPPPPLLPYQERFLNNIIDSAESTATAVR